MDDASTSPAPRPFDGAHVAILGWAGSTARQLRTVARWYEHRGATTTLARAEIYRNMKDPDGWDREGEALAERLLEGAGDGPLVVHLFSNAGFWTHAHCLLALERRPEGRRLIERLRAVVMDSAPGIPERVGPWHYARYSAMAMMPMALRALRRPPALHHPLLTPAFVGFLLLWYHVSPVQRRKAQESLEVIERVGSWPHLLLYSTADVLVRPDLVEAFADRLGDRVQQRVRWADSGHVRHMLQHRSEYFALVERFVSARCAAPLDG